MQGNNSVARWNKTLARVLKIAGALRIWSSCGGGITRQTIFAKGGAYMINRRGDGAYYRVFLLSILWITSALYSASGYAHAQFKIDGPTPPRYNNPGIKTSPPCGSEAQWNPQRTSRKGIFVQGETVTVEWVETVNHGGSFVFDFAPANDQGFESNTISRVTDTQNDSATPHYYSQSIQLNYAPCDACTLRMRQDMEDAQNYYLSCADIVIVSGMDNVPPELVGESTASPAANDILLAWTNPPDAKGIVVLRDTGPIATQLENRKDYIVGDKVGNADVVYRGGAETFSDPGVAPQTDYTYKIFAYDADYNYNGGVILTATTLSAPTPGGGGSGNNDTLTNSGSDDPGQTNNGGGGAGAWIWILLATLLIFQRPAWKRLL